jgi:hypothetical protein
VNDRRKHAVPVTVRGHVDQTTWRDAVDRERPAFVEAPRFAALSWDGRTYVEAPC